MTLLERIRPDLKPRRDNVPAREQRPGPRERVLDSRPEWVRRRDEGLLQAKELVD